ncbi:hypothetical protein CMV30_17395 [Nibricoccus aquaticus]|uniref:Uncharacterized protein n=1 Tax=Nibricoccus aquaticus TaxID=2576891 RepID=A0A290QM11_9BACT|nr:hypothetical protein [Nibricoccus aquaticus]ATC65581.1 hypothetical protein CMV30_17395 [Nibricoccus aquaticus]
MSAFTSTTATPPPLPAKSAQPARSRLITALAWSLIVVSALLLPISLITLLMFIAGSYGTAHASLLDALVVIARPPATLLAGIGLLCRWRWAHTYVLTLTVSFALWSAAAIARGPSPERTYTSPSGVPTTVLASSVNYSFHLTCIAISAGVLLTLTNRSIRREFRLGLPQSSPSKPAVTPHLPVASPLLHARAATPDTRDIPPATLAQKHRSQRRALVTAICCFALLAAGMGWLVHRGLATGETVSPTKRATQSRAVSRAQEPLFFWVCLSLYSAIGLGALGLSTWGTREASRVPHPLPSSRH